MLGECKTNPLRDSRWRNELFRWYHRYRFTRNSSEQRKL